VKMSVVDPLSAIETAPKAFVSVGCAAFTTRQLAVTAFVTLVAPLMLAAAFVNAAGFAAQLALVCAARFVTPVTVIVHEAVSAFIVTAENAIESGEPTVTTLEPAHPAPNVTVGVADVNLRFAGRLSVNAIPERAGFVPVFVSVKMSVVLAVSLIAAAANPFVSVGVPAVTTRHWSAEAFVAPAVVTDAVRFVNAAAGHVGFTCEAAFVTPATVTVQLAVPEAIASPVTPESTRVPLLYAALAGPEHPAEYESAGVAELIASPVGSVSPTLIPACAGFVPVFVSVKMSVVVPPSAIETAPKVLATAGTTRFTTRHWSVELFVALVVATFADRFVNAAGRPTQLAFVCVAAFVTPATVTVHEAVVAVIAMPVSPESTRVPAV
jgi:hypothetical protein